jgi:hypothetical protein
MNNFVDWNIWREYLRCCTLCLPTNTDQLSILGEILILNCYSRTGTQIVCLENISRFTLLKQHTVLSVTAVLSGLMWKLNLRALLETRVSCDKRQSALNFIRWICVAHCNQRYCCSKWTCSLFFKTYQYFKKHYKMHVLT